MRFETRCTHRLIIFIIQNNKNDVISSLDDNIGQIFAGHRVYSFMENGYFCHYEKTLAPTAPEKRVNVF